MEELLKEFDKMRQQLIYNYASPELMSVNEFTRRYSELKELTKIK